MGKTFRRNDDDFNRKTKKDGRVKKKNKHKKSRYEENLDKDVLSPYFEDIDPIDFEDIDPINEEN